MVTITITKKNHDAIQTNYDHHVECILELLFIVMVMVIVSTTNILEIAIEIFNIQCFFLFVFSVL